NNVFGESSDPDAIAKTVFTESVGLNEMQSADPFNIYDLLNKGKQQENTKELDHVNDNISEPKKDLQEDKDINSTCNSMGVTSWFSVLQQASMDFSTDGRIVWVEVEGVPFKLWTADTFNKIAKKWGDLLDIDDQEDTCYHSKRAKEVPGWVSEFMEESDDESIFEEEMPDMEGTP
nr:glucose-methanol-choline oxidoreductase, FAD/NAD(P)-binding domain protein [Tanacetum cinerariifolium]